MEQWEAAGGMEGPTAGPTECVQKPAHELVPTAVDPSPVAAEPSPAAAAESATLRLRAQPLGRRRRDRFPRPGKDRLLPESAQARPSYGHRSVRRRHRVALEVL